MFSTCLSVCPFVRSFVCYQLLKATLRKRMTDFNANFRKSSSGQGHERSTSRGQEVKGQGHTRVEDRFGGLAEALFVTTLGGVYILF